MPALSSASTRLVLCANSQLRRPDKRGFPDQHDGEADREHVERGQRLVDEHLVDDQLEEDRRDQPHQLEEEGGDQHVAKRRRYLTSAGMNQLMSNGRASPAIRSREVISSSRPREPLAELLGGPDFGPLAVAELDEDARICRCRPRP